MSAEADRTTLRILASQFEQAATTKPKLYHQRITLPLVVDHRVLDQWQKIAMPAPGGGTYHVAFCWADHCRQHAPAGCKLVEVTEPRRSQRGKACEYDAYFGEAGAKESLAHFRRLVATIPANLQPWIDRLYQLAVESPSAALCIGLETFPFGLRCRLERPGQPDEYQLLQPASRRGLAGDLFTISAVALAGIETAKPSKGKPRKPKPKWDAERRELRFNGELSKRYRQPAKWQERILQEFQEARWPLRLDDPLPGDQEADTRQRLADAVRGLNTANKFVRFELAGDSESILWQPLETP